jgi:hypothetical protein
MAKINNTLDFVSNLDKKSTKSSKKDIEDLVKYEYKVRKQLEKTAQKEKLTEAEAYDRFVLNLEKNRAKKASKLTLDSITEFNKLMAEGSDKFGEKLKYTLKASASEFTKNTINVLNSFGTNSALAQGVDKYIGVYQQYMSGISTRLQGINTSYNQITGTVSNAIGSSPYVSQVKVMENLSKLVEQGIAYNVEQRAFLATMSDRIASTFDVANGTLLRLIRLQQADSTVARLGIESALTKFLNTNFSDTSYLNINQSISDALLEVESQLGTSRAAEFNYSAQKWLGSLYSVGVSESTIQSLAQGLNYLGTGNISALSGNESLQRLLLMGAQLGGIDYAKALTGGISGAEASQLLKGVVQFGQQIAGNTNQVVKSQYAQLFGLTIADMTALLNLSSKDLDKIAENMLSYSSAIAETENQLSSIGSRTSLSDKVNNVIDNTMASIGERIAGDAVTYATWVTTGLLEKSGIADALKVTVLGTTVDTVGLIRTGILGISAVTEVTSALSKLLSGNAGLSLNN